MKVSKCSYVSSDATLIASARRPRKCYKNKRGEEQGKDQGQDAVLYSDDRDASWKKKGNKLLLREKTQKRTSPSGFWADILEI